ncbi:MAG: hypothetical protein GWM98_25555 [Nitrospinaceae bacterium]|nr:hypothetical protein [Nitrospinaceae bacterium]NIR57221.1 hypothetical protein [Nitrospinaceae bacterium]NIS87669.1 hypothetical protein [Nitrospinaceae bacterium]NIT84535.1 hypothetical protein [Nitrospinaceae bacterium]NIU46721.1 hypothetical protein [Nitrospinaceae bacterium]
MMYFLGAKLKKVGPERTQLALYQKMQGECSSSGYGTAVIGTIFSLGLLGPTIFDGVAEEQKACKELSTLHPDEKDLKGIMRSVDGILLEGGDI